MTSSSRPRPAFAAYSWWRRNHAYLFASPKAPPSGSPRSTLPFSGIWNLKLFGSRLAFCGARIGFGWYSRTIGLSQAVHIDSNVRWLQLLVAPPHRTPIDNSAQISGMSSLSPRNSIMPSGNLPMTEPLAPYPVSQSWFSWTSCPLSLSCPSTVVIQAVFTGKTKRGIRYPGQL